MKATFILVSTLIMLNSGCSTLKTPSPTLHEMVYPISEVNEPLDIGQTQEMTYSKPLPKFVRTAEVPQTQRSAKYSDTAWVSQQEPAHSTILVKNDDNPLSVSQSLMSLPKNNRTAVIKYHYQGQIHYASIYGSYTDTQSASAALEQLPVELRSEAKVIQWHQIQDLDTNS